MKIKPVVFLGSSKEDLSSMPPKVRDVFGYNLYLAQCGKFPSIAKPLKGIKVGDVTNVTELIDNFNGDTYRAVYTVKFKDTMYILHCFQKKSKSGISTPKPDIDLIKKRLQQAIELEKEKDSK